ncbi:MAG: hypothetical protein AAGJ46_09810 [Planctomycetota bacterium]
MNLSRSCKRTRVANAAAAGQTEVVSTSIDGRGFDACEFVVSFGAIVTGAVTTVKAQGSADNTTFTDLAGVSQSVADDADNSVVIVDVGHPRHRYLRCVVTRATQDATVDGIVAQQYLAREEPVDHDEAVAATFFHAPPESA